mmetsp:Transcript_4085/g.14294  ORF Transcript_4085/g.14294 Transcript_4085/m.14294 type:complete len:205 (-) Transcript_4085:15-629(-)
MLRLRTLPTSLRNLGTPPWSPSPTKYCLGLSFWSLTFSSASSQLKPSYLLVRTKLRPPRSRSATSIIAARPGCWLSSSSATRCCASASASPRCSYSRLRRLSSSSIASTLACVFAPSPSCPTHSSWHAGLGVRRLRATPMPLRLCSMPFRRWSSSCCCRSIERLISTLSMRSFRFSAVSSSCSDLSASAVWRPAPPSPPSPPPP